jgi:hypothetical protein
MFKNKKFFNCFKKIIYFVIKKKFLLLSNNKNYILYIKKINIEKLINQVFLIDKLQKIL